MKRSRRWLLMTAALIGLMAHAGALRAPSALFGKNQAKTTTQSTTENLPTDDDVTTDPPQELISPRVNHTSTSNKRVLTGIPQIDWIWDPNLPRELNGYNLSEYPFLNAVPTNEEIAFPCGDHHDGFYASIKFGCQLYHHCIHGIRYDFLCANFTAFDQKTFICHFVSEVDCKNSHKFWHRNDALYIATTAKPTTTTTTEAPLTQAPIHRPVRPLRRPLRRKRPQVDYYYDDDYEDDYYEDRPNRRRKQRPRNRRPEFDDYDTQPIYDEDERFDRRPMSQDRGRGNEDDDYEYEQRRPADRIRNRNRPNENRRFNEDERPIAERRKPINDERRVANDDRRQYKDERRNLNSDRRTPVDERNVQEPIERRPAIPERRPAINERRKLNERRPAYEDDTAPRRAVGGGANRPLRRDEEIEERPYKQAVKEEIPEDTVKVQPSSSGGTLFNRPRTPPKIRPPVPVNARDKFEFSTIKPTAPNPPSVVADDEYYDDYEDIVEKPKAPIREEVEDKRAVSSQLDARRPVNRGDQLRAGANVNKPNRAPLKNDEYYTDEYEERPKANKNFQNFRSRTRDGIRPDAKVAIRDVVDDEQIINQRINVNKREQAPVRTTYRFTAKDAPISVPEDSDLQEKRGSIRYDQRDSLYRLKNDKNSSKAQKVSDSFIDDDDLRPLEPEAIRPAARDSYTIVDRDVSPAQNIDTRQSAKQSLSDIVRRQQTAKVDEINNKYREPATRPLVRVVKRPFLPSRGGNPYLPRGLQPLGNAQTIDQTTELLQQYSDDNVDNNAPLTNVNNANLKNSINRPAPRTTQQPQIDSPHSLLDDIYNNDYDVTLNDALNPTLKPLSPNRASSNGFSQANKYDQQTRYSNQPQTDIQTSPELNYSPSLIRSTAIRAPITSQLRKSAQQQQEYYDYDY